MFTATDALFFMYFVLNLLVSVLDVIIDFLYIMIDFK